MKTLLLALVTLIAAACHAGARAPERAYGGDVERGRQLIRTYGCHSCHTIPGVRGADGLVGPPLTRMGARVYVAGHLSNTPENLMRWIQNPPLLRPDTGMPATGVTNEDVRHIVAYLYSLK
jgi:cytochrome c